MKKTLNNTKFNYLILKSFLNNVSTCSWVTKHDIKGRMFSTAKTASAKSSGDKKTERGLVSMLKDGIVTILYLKKLKAGEIVWIQGQSDNNQPVYIRALILNLNENNSQGILLGNERLVKEGALVFRSNSLFKLKCSLGLFGQVLDGLGENKISNQKTIKESSSLVEQKATGIIDREPVRIPLRTGIKSIDSLVPIGRGQRELIIGDRQTGKTSVALDAILNHVKLNNRYKFKNKKSTLADLRNIVWFVYNAIGQKQSTVNQFRESLIKYDAFWFTSIVASTAAEPAPLQFLSPYTACTLGEFIRDVVGGHCTIIYDDLSKHAVAYRQMSLLLRRPPGREAFPGDVFYVHSRLLERAGSLTVTKKQVRGTLTAFPIIETQAGDVSAYIPTNVISITDGQIFLETELFYRGIRPAVNVGLSVSRVGSAAQPGIMKRVAGSLKMELAQYREIEGFSKLGASLDEQTQKILNRGENLIEILKQNLHVPLTTIEQVLSIYLGVGYSGGWLNDVSKVKSKKNSGANLYSRIRVRTSWLEWFRMLSGDFNIFQVSPFISSLLKFSETLGIIDLNLYNRSENSLLTLFKIHPIVFFDDVIVSFLKETSVLNAPTANASKLLSNTVYLYNLRYVKNAEKSTTIKNKVKNKSNLNVLLKKLSVRNLLIQGLKFKKAQTKLSKVLRVWVKTKIFKQTTVHNISTQRFKNNFPFSSVFLNTLEVFLNFAIVCANKNSVTKSGYLKIAQNNKFINTLKA